MSARCGFPRAILRCATTAEIVSPDEVRFKAVFVPLQFCFLLTSSFAMILISPDALKCTGTSYVAECYHAECNELAQTVTVHAPSHSPSLMQYLQIVSCALLGLDL